MYEAYSNIFARRGINVRPVIADSGAMGGKDTHEFMALSAIGEDTIAYSDESQYAANIEMAEVLYQEVSSDEEPKALEKIHTPNVKTIEELTAFLQVSAEACIKSVLFKADDRFVLVLVRGDHEVNDIKVKTCFMQKLWSLPHMKRSFSDSEQSQDLSALSVSIKMLKYMPIML